MNGLDDERVAEFFCANGLANHVAHGNLAAALAGPVGTTFDRIPIAAD